VHVMSCATSEIVYGFEIYGEKDRDVIPCLGRTLPRSCYEIRVSFQAPSVAAGEYAYLFGSFLFSAFLAFLVLTKKPMVAEPSNGAKSKFIQIGKILFYYEKQLLKHGQSAIPLTSKENQVLNIFASNLNQIVSRDLLQKEVWENEGVLVGRSLEFLALFI